MAVRSMGSATIAFGLVSIVTKIYTAHDAAASVSYNWLHKDCGTRIKQESRCPDCDVALDKEDMVKGYEYTKGQYVEVSPEELKVLEAVSDGTISIEEFVPAGSVPPEYFSSLNYLAPDKGGDRAFRLLIEALGRTGKVAIGRYAARGKQYLVMIAPHGDRLVMHQLKYAYQVRAIEDIPAPNATVTDAEIELGVQLVMARAAESFDPSAYTDEVRERVLAMLAAKVEGTPIEAPVAPKAPAALDLVAALRASVEAGQKAKVA